jgi:Ni/Co efflux regulator RcnB
MKRFIIITLGVIASFTALPDSADAAVIHVSSSSHHYDRDHYRHHDRDYGRHHHRDSRRVYHRGYYTMRHGHRVWIPAHTVVVYF